MKEDTRKAWEAFLNPDILRKHLMMTSMFLAAFEILKESIIGRIRDFFTFGFDEHGYKYDPEYKSEVLSKHKIPVIASLYWLKDNNVINDIDINEFEAIRDCRNRVAHELMQFIMREDNTELHMRFMGMVAMLNKIEKWWIINVEIPTDGSFNDKDITEDMVTPGPVMSIRIMMDVAFGSEEESMKYYKHFVENIRGT